MTKQLIEYGVANSKNIVDEAKRADVPVEKVARGYTYTTREDEFPPMPLVLPENPFNDEVLAAKTILDLGCGVGRNLPWIYENTEAMYYGLDPNQVMLDNFWAVTNATYTNRTTLMKDFTHIPSDMIFDVVVSTYVFQHLGYSKTPKGGMNPTDITQEIMKYTREGTIWILLEHEREESWMDKWFEENNITPDVFELNWSGIEELTHRGNDAHLVIWRQR